MSIVDLERLSRYEAELMSGIWDKSGTVNQKIPENQGKPESKGQAVDD